MEVKQEPVLDTSVRCPACDAVFPSPQWLAVHEKTYHNVKWFECELCDRKARTEDELQKHVNNKHKSRAVEVVENVVVVEGDAVTDWADQELLNHVGVKQGIEDFVSVKQEMKNYVAAKQDLQNFASHKQDLQNYVGAKLEVQRPGSVNKENTIKVKNISELKKHVNGKQLQKHVKHVNGKLESQKHVNGKQDLHKHVNGKQEIPKLVVSKHVGSKQENQKNGGSKQENQKHGGSKLNTPVESVVVEGGVVECLPATPPLSPSLVGSSVSSVEGEQEKKAGSQCQTCHNVLPNNQWLKIHMKKIHKAQILNSESGDKDAEHNEALEKLREYEEMKKVFDALKARLNSFEEHFISGKKPLDYNQEDSLRLKDIRDEFHVEGEPCENNLFKYLGLNPSASSSEEASDDAGGDSIDDSALSDESPLEKKKYIAQFFPAPMISSKKKKSKLREEDWKDDASLPLGWKALEKSSSDGKNLTYFRSPEGATFPSRKAMVMAMAVETGKYTSEQMQLAEKGLEENAKWSNVDKTIPNGWKSRTIKCSGTNQVKTFFLSPEGKQFQSRKAVYQHMVEDGGFSSSDLELVAKGFEKRGIKWVSNDPNVPHGWKTRTVEIQGPNGPMTKNYFLAPNGKMFMSRKSALQHMVEDASYDPQDVNIMKRAPVNMKKKSYKIEFVDNDPSVPPGWKVAQKQQILSGKQTFSTCYLCPQGKFFYNRHSALKYMLEDGGFPLEDIEIMKESLEGEGWKLDEDLLPAGWFVKELEKVVKGDLIIDHHYLTHNFDLFKSTKAVLQHMVESQIYAPEQIKAVEARFAAAMKRFTEKRHEWQTDPTVPSGWKTRMLNTKETQRKAFLSPDGSQFFGRRAAIDYMIENQYNSQEIDFMRENLMESGWYKDPSFLPEGWMVIDSMAKGRIQKSYLSPENVKFRGISGVLKHMRETGSYGTDEVEKVENKVIENERAKGEGLKVYQESLTNQPEMMNKRKNSSCSDDELHNEGPLNKKLKTEVKTSNLEEQIHKLKNMVNVDESEIDWIKKEIDTQENGYDPSSKLMINYSDGEDRDAETPDSKTHMSQFLDNNPKRKTPQQMSSGQLDILLAEFNVSTRPSPQTVQRLSVQTKLTAKRVRKWFDNRKRRMGITCNGGSSSSSVPVSLTPLVSAIPIEITPSVNKTPKPPVIRAKPDSNILTPVQVDALNSALNSYKFLPRTTTDKLVEETGINRNKVERWFDENMGEEGDAMERWEARSRLLETIEQPPKDTPPKTNRVIQFLDLEDAEEIDDAINDAVEIGGEEEEEEEEFDDEEEEIELPDEEMLGEEEREDSMSWSNDVDSTIDSFFGGHSVFGSNEVAGKEMNVNNSFLDNSANAANKNKMAQVHLDILIPYFEEFPQPTTEQKLELAEQTGLTKQVIQRWFDNRRRRFRK